MLEINFLLNFFLPNKSVMSKIQPKISFFQLCEKTIDFEENFCPQNERA